MQKKDGYALQNHDNEEYSHLKIEETTEPTLL
jgi:hypothetical protein